MVDSPEINFNDLVHGIPSKRFMRAGEIKKLIARLNKLNLIMQVSRSLMGAIDVKKLLAEILNKACIVMNAYRASLFMIDEERDEIYASVTLDGSEIRLPRGSGIIGHVADSGETVNIPDAYADARFNRDNDLRTGFQTKSILCMAVRNQKDEIIGALQILNKLDGPFFTGEDEELLAAFTAMAGICLENARAYQELANERNSLEDKVVERTAELAMAKAETDQIMQAVEEGLFLLYRAGERYIIGAEYSQALCNIFEQDELRSKDFIAAIKAFLPAEIVEKSRVFMELMFDAKKRQAMLLKLNPLASVEAQFADGKRKYLRFSFNRITLGNDSSNAASVDHLMATVSDVTHEIELRQKLAETEAENRRKNELLLAILESDPATLGEFLNDFNEDIETALRLFSESKAQTGDARREALLAVYRIVHSVKGNAALLNFQTLTALAHTTESHLDNLLVDTSPASHDWSHAADTLQALKAIEMELRQWLQKIALFQTPALDAKKQDFLRRTLVRALEKAAAAQQKNIEFVAENFSSTDFPAPVRKALKDALVHLVRNAAVHGIESAAERRAASKPDTGRLTLSSVKISGTTQILLEDDGCGIDGDAIAKKLVSQNQITANEVVGMQSSDKNMLIFRAGVSTHEGISEFAGRGMGMNIVADTLQRIGARIEVDSARGKFTRFKIIVPIGGG